VTVVLADAVKSAALTAITVTNWVPVMLVGAA
jgi:hypothetical protein